MSDAEARREFAEEIVRRLRQAGYQSLWAGGCVRDLILGQTPSDYDVATDARPEQVTAVLPFRTIPVGISFGVVRVNHPRRRGVEVEIATFRNDGAYLDGRRPESVAFSTAEEDAARRDFTINGMFLDPLTGTVIDYVGGREDLERKVLRAIGEPAERFREDKLRLLRAVRFASRFGLSIEPLTYEAIRAMASDVGTVSPERIAQELRRMLTHRTRASALRLANESGLVAAIFPELTVDDEPWGQTLQILAALPDNSSFVLAFATLLLGSGPEIADAIARRLRLSNAERDLIVWLVGSQSALIEAETMPASRLKRLLAHPAIGELLELHRAKALATSGDLAPVEFCRVYLDHEPAGPINPPPLLTGVDLVRAGLKPGPVFAQILEEIRDAQLDGKLLSKGDALAWLGRRG